MIARGCLARALFVLGLATGLATTAGFAAGAPASCTLARIAEWHTRPTRGQPIVSGTINTQPVGIMLDTGASRSIILRSAAERLGLVRYGARGSRMAGVGGETAVEAVLLDEFAIGDYVRRNWRVLVAGEHAFGGDVALIVGEDLFRRAEIEFDLAHDTVRLFEARDCDGRSLAYWATEGAGVVDLDSTSGGTIEVNVEVNGRPVVAMLDSGAFASVLTTSRASALGVTPQTAGVVSAGCSAGIGEKSIEFWVGPFASFRIGDELIRDPKIRFGDTWKFSTFKGGGLVSSRPAGLPDMLLGADFLRSHRVLVAHSQQKMYFTYSGGTVFPSEPPKPCDDASPRDGGAKAAPAPN
jgi:predicted aspartyl protease